MRLSCERYYEQFSCLASRCPDSCCYLWEVLVDEEAASYYRRLPGPLGDQLRSVLRQEDGETFMTLTPDRRCPMWRADGLCELQAQLGHGALCQTCRDFPRLRHDYGSFTELGLELSCPEAARMILSPEGHDIVTQTVPGGEAPDYDPEIMSLLLRSREQALALVDDPRYTPGQILACLILYALEVEAAMDDPDDAPDIPDPAVSLHRLSSLTLTEDLNGMVDFYRQLEILTPQWRQRLKTFTPDFQWHPAARLLIRYFIRRYWLQAISDDALTDRVKFIAASCIVIHALGGDFERTAQQYSKEIENDAANVDRLLDATFSEPAFSDLNLLGLLLRQTS